MLSVDVGPQTRLCLERTITGPGYSMVFQPIFDLQRPTAGGGTPVGWEALARFDIAVPPALMFAAARDVGLGVELEARAIATALGVLSELSESVFLAVNASVTTVLSGQAYGLVAAVASDRVLLDLVEVARINTATLHGEFAGLPGALSDLRDIGVRVAIDDTWVSPTLLEDLVLLPFDLHEFGRSLVNGIASNPAARASVKTLVEFTDATGASLIAEGIETHQELDNLTRLGIRYGQGYLLGRPAPFPTWR